MKVVASLCAAIVVTMLASLPAIDTTEDTELRDLHVTGWNCVNQLEGTAQTQDARERNRMKNRWMPANLSAFTVEPLDTTEFLKKVRDYDSRLQSKRRGELTAAQKNQLDSYEIRLCLSRAGLSWRTQARPKQQIAAMRPFMTGTWRFLRTQAITRRK
jgi:hypothetical protein